MAASTDCACDGAGNRISFPFEVFAESGLSD